MLNNETRAEAWAAGRTMQRAILISLCSNCLKMPRTTWDAAARLHMQRGSQQHCIEHRTRALAVSRFPEIVLAVGNGAQLQQDTRWMRSL
jgi:hypothetical protein